MAGSEIIEELPKFNIGDIVRHCFSLGNVQAKEGIIISCPQPEKVISFDPITSYRIERPKLLERVYFCIWSKHRSDLKTMCRKLKWKQFYSGNSQLTPCQTYLESSLMFVCKSPSEWLQPITIEEANANRFKNLLEENENGP